MTANISLGQYLPGNSVVHRLDAQRIESQPPVVYRVP